MSEAIFTHDTSQFNLLHEKKEYSYFPPFTTRGSGACGRDVKSRSSSGLSGGEQIKLRFYLDVHDISLVFLPGCVCQETNIDSLPGCVCKIPA